MLDTVIYMTGLLYKADGILGLPQNMPSSDDTGIKLGATSYFTSKLKNIRVRVRKNEMKC